MVLGETLKKSKVALVLFTGLAIVLLVQTLLVVSHFANRPFDPLGPYPVQAVTNEVGLSGFPTVQPGEDLTVEATKCSQADETLDGFGSMKWETVDPGGSVFQTISASPTTFPPGCQDLKFVNPVPPEVVERNQRLYEQGEDLVVWHLVGFEQPVDNDGELGVGIQWKSEEFVILP